MRHSSWTQWRADWTTSSERNDKKNQFKWLQIEGDK